MRACLRSINRIFGSFGGQLSSALRPRGSPLLCVPDPVAVCAAFQNTSKEEGLLLRHMGLLCEVWIPRSNLLR